MTTETLAESIRKIRRLSDKVGYGLDAYYLSAKADEMLAIINLQAAMLEKAREVLNKQPLMDWNRDEVLECLKSIDPNIPLTKE